MNSRRVVRFHGKAALALAAGAVVVALVSASQLYFNWVSQGFEASFSQLALAKLVEWGLWASYVPVMIWIEQRYGFAARPLPAALFAHLTAALVFFAIMNGVLTGLTLAVDAAAASDPFMRAYVRRAGAKLVSTLLVYASIIGGYTLLIMREERHRQAAVSAQLRADLSDAQLLNLKMQIHPHFLFNALHTVAGLVREGDRNTAVETIEELSELLRRALRDLEQQEVPLSEELEFLERYVHIQQLRFGDRLAVTIDADAAARTVLVPSLLLQPIVENAIRHGLDLEHGTGLVTLVARRSDHTLVVNIEDNGTGLTADLLKEGRGLGTTRRRLQQLHGEDASLSLERADTGGTRVVIRLPCRPDARRAQRAVELIGG